jgi:hypothetical protein
MTIVRLSDKGGGPLSPAEADGNAGEFDRRTALGWRDNIVELKVDSSSPNAPTLNPFRGGILAWSFPAGEMTEAHSAWHIDHDYALGTKLYLHVHWSPKTASLGTVRWGFEYSVAKGHQQQAFPATTTVYVEQTSLGVDHLHYVTEVSEANAIDGAALGIEPDTVILVRMFRDGGHVNDTFPDEAFVSFIDLHYQADRATTPFKAPNFLTGS